MVRSVRLLLDCFILNELLVLGCPNKMNVLFLALFALQRSTSPRFLFILSHINSFRLYYALGLECQKVISNIILDNLEYLGLLDHLINHQGCM